MKTQFHAPEGVFVYSFETKSGEKQVLILRPGDHVTINGIEITVTIEYIDALYSITHRTELDDLYYLKELDVMFEKRKSKKCRSEDGFVEDPVEALCDRECYFTIQLNHGKKIVLKRGGQTSKLAPALAAMEKIKKKLSQKDLDLFYCIYGCGMKQTEYAQLYGLKKTAANNRVARFNEKVRKLLAEEGIDDDFFS